MSSTFLRRSIGVFSVLLAFVWFVHKTTEINSQVQHSEQLELEREEFYKETAAIRRQRQDIHLPILVYHYVEVVTDLRDTSRQSMAISPHTFEEQIVTLISNGYNPIHLEDLSAYFKGEKDLPVKPIILTFDDGYRDFYTDVLPILKRYQVPATVYIVSSFLDFTHNYLSTEQFMEITKEPLIEIGAHTVSHFSLTHLDPLVATRQIVESKKSLEKLLGREIRHFAYPYGQYQPDTLNLVEKAGFDSAVSMDLGTIQNYAYHFHLKRLRPGGLTGNAFLDLIETKR